MAYGSVVSSKNPSLVVRLILGKEVAITWESSLTWLIQLELPYLSLPIPLKTHSRIANQDRVET